MSTSTSERRIRVIVREPNQEKFSSDTTGVVYGGVRVAVFRYRRDATAGDVAALSDQAAVIVGPRKIADVALIMPHGCEFELYEEEPVAP